MRLHLETPLLESRRLSLLSERSIWLKFEALQPPGSFKIRGIGFACQYYAEQGARRFIASSGGNAGLSVAYAGRLLNIPVTVVVPETTSDTAKELLELENAKVIVHGVSWQEANDYARSLLQQSDAFLHPFDDPLLWKGHATLVDEIVQAGMKPDAIVLSVGGGGLLSGIAEGLHNYGWDDIPILAVETEGAASFYQAAKAGHRVELDNITSVATSLGTKQVCDRALEWANQHPIENILVNDHSAVTACEGFLSDHRVLVEPACGASLAIPYDQPEALHSFKTVLVVVCGGVTATIDQIRKWCQG